SGADRGGVSGARRGRPLSRALPARLDGRGRGGRRRRDCAAGGGAEGAPPIAVRGGGPCRRRAPARQCRRGARDRAGDTRPAPRRCRPLASVSLRSPPAMAGPARAAAPGGEAVIRRRAAAAVVALCASVLSAQQPTFRATTALVSVSVSVKRGNAV